MSAASVRKNVIKPYLLTVGIMLLFFIVGCKGTWTGFFYPHGNLSDETQWRIRHGLKSLEECRDWAEGQMATTDGGDDYECGKNCKLKKDYKIYICDETVK